jgi:hypothetical protein
VREAFAWFSLLNQPIFFVNTETVNIEDLCSGRPGAIVRCLTDPGESVMIYVAPHEECLGCVGGMISDE